MPRKDPIMENNLNVYLTELKNSAKAANLNSYNKEYAS
jgi:hypothetical protein